MRYRSPNGWFREMGFGAKQQFGKYIALDSCLHRLDPLVKVGVFGVIVAAIFLTATWLHLAYVAAYVSVLCLVSRVRFWFYLEGLKYFVWMFALSFAINVMFPKGASTQAWSYEALSIAGIFAVRLALMIMGATLFTVVTCPSEIGDSILALSKVGGRVGRRSVEMASLFSISLRFVPVMFEEAERIKAAQMLRGQSATGLLKRVRSVIGLIVPLIESSLRRATNLGFALEARCYGYGVPKIGGLRVGRDEIIIGSSGIIVLAGLVLMRSL
jgi:energy-coupling factor transport system permease protein